jgi:alanine-synthesizing transaminase
MRDAMSSAPFSSRSRFAARPNALTLALEQARRSGSALLDLSESNPTRVALSPSAGTLAATLAGNHAVYAPEPFGLESAREALCRELAASGVTVAPTHVLLSASTSEAYGHLFKLLCEPGDELLVPVPSYPLLEVLAQLERVKLVPYPLRYDGEWHVDGEALRARVSERTRGLLTVHPNNPTGSYLKRDELDLLASLRVPIVSDEVFAEYALRDDARRVASALEAADRTLVFRLGGLSKSCALPQLKLAWTVIAGPSALRDEACSRLEHIADAYLSPNTPVQVALPQLLEHGVDTRARILERVRLNLATLRLALTGSAASVLTVEGGWYAIVRLPALLDDEGWALTLLQEGVVVQPGYYYELEGSHVVLSLIPEADTFARGAGVLVDCVARRIAS